jgi:hypothetical protein
MPASCLPVTAPVSIVTEITIAIATSPTAEIVFTVASITSEDVCEPRTTIGSTTVPPAVTRVMTINKLVALPIEM